jgi:hypothetical protein
MITDDPERARALRDRLQAQLSAASLPSDVAELAPKLLETVADPEFPGALIPALDSNGELCIYALAATNAEWRRLSPILLAFAGPTISSFDGTPSDLGNDPLAAIALESAPAVTAVLRLPSDSRMAAAGLRGTLRTRDTLARAPDLQRRPPEPTSWLLSQFQDYLNVGARAAAFGVLHRLASELRLDALNLKFLEVQALATFGEWRAITELPGFANLCIARRPAAVTAALLEALYRTHIEGAFQQGAEAETRALYEDLVRPLAQPMLSLPAPPNLPAGGWRLFALEAWTSPSRKDLLQALEAHRETIGWLDSKLSDSAESPKPAEAQAPIEQAREALTTAEAAGSLDSLSKVLAALKQLDPDELAQLRAAEPFRSMLETVDEVASPKGVPASWPEWFAGAADPDFTSALDVAQRGMNEWPPAAGLSDPVHVQAMAAAIEHAQSDPLAAERSALALPFLVGWLRRDPAFPRSEATPVYSSLLTLLALGVSRGRPVYDSSQVLVEALLGVGLEPRKYRDVLDDVSELAGSGLGVEMVYWLLEIIEDLYRYASPDSSAREAFLHSSLARIAPIAGRLSSLQRAAIRKLSDELGWAGAGFGDEVQDQGGDSLAARLSGKRIAIYTLTESSSRQAKEALETIAPDVTVECSADHVGTGKLRAMAQGSDLFVMTSLSAKHAASDYIKDHRGDRPLIYAQGRGFSSILRAIEEHLRRIS